MRVVRFGTYPAILVAVAAIEQSIAGVLFALVGMVVTAAVGQLGLLVGTRAHSVVAGVGPRLAEWRSARRTVVLRAFPLPISVEVGTRKKRAVMVSVGAVAVTVALFALLTDYVFALGGLAALVSAALVERREVDTPCVSQVVELVQAGELDAAERLVSQLTVANPTARTIRASRVLVLEARGRYGEALALAIGMSEAEGQDAAAAMAAVAGLTGAAIEAGQLDAHQGLPVAARALNEAVELGKPSYMLDGVRALIALLAGDPQLAVRLARTACRNNDGSLGRADDLATLARAYMAAGDNSKARATLAKAERLVPWWPRVALTRSRLDLAQA
ncbi:hypothetical protein ALI144C_13040 [Actinosynnema sp. ALI-1.44]|uniref:tetratricopeptide repeat protein n=1 Tax=Actinosynnema sp. ALI-1.44 TaxID=1933779 RepID=UPI00097C7453|nr:hypothetical protein [Actinosynnema sp. ALI-1.44]ONI85237.1 hypothetical protein ALI144C_13040 [Actinosynnema sp. ALI-1.44]